MSSPRLLVYGAGRLGRQVLHHIQQYTDATVLGYVDDMQAQGSPAPGGTVCVGKLEQAASLQDTHPGHASLVFAIGYSDMAARGKALERALAIGYQLYSFIHPRAIVEPGARIGEGCILLAGSIVDQNVSIGRACFVDIAVRIGEDCVIGDNNYFSSGAAVGGSALVGQGNFFGMDVTTVTGVRVGSNCFINAKSLVARDLPDDTKFVQLHKSKELPMPKRTDGP